MRVRDAAACSETNTFSSCQHPATGRQHPQASDCASGSQGRTEPLGSLVDGDMEVLRELTVPARVLSRYTDVCTRSSAPVCAASATVWPDLWFGGNGCMGVHGREGGRRAGMERVGLHGKRGKTEAGTSGRAEGREERRAEP